MRKKKETEKRKTVTMQSRDMQDFSEILGEMERRKFNDYNPNDSPLPVTQMITDDSADDSDVIVNVGVASHIGTRASQQDSLIIGIGNSIAPVYNGKFIAAVCDGMGGLRGGEVASALCAKTFYEDFFNVPDVKSYPDFLKDEIDVIDKKVAALKDSDGNPLKAGSTFISIVFDNGNLYWACVGDSHLYIVRGGEIIQVNRDHNYSLILKERVRLGEITEEEANSNKQKDALISYMGMNGVKYSDINEMPFRLLPNDCVILCSDGLYRLVSNSEMVDILNVNPFNMNNAANMMVDAACDKMASHQDNTSVIIFKYI